jgi:flavin reductase (DIM6/NTAB) family NADH-FMN oxidoreductase RutF
MTSGFTKANPYSLNEKLFHVIGKEWFLIAAGTSDDYNMMTASWGSMGILWNKPVVSVFIRPHRYTYEFVEKNEFFSLNILDNSYREILNLLGQESGRNMDKMNVPGLDISTTDAGTVFFNQARLVFECKKIYFSDIDPALFIDPSINNNYPKKDYHRMYIGEIVNVLIKD